MLWQITIKRDLRATHVQSFRTVGAIRVQVKLKQITCSVDQYLPLLIACVASPKPILMAVQQLQKDLSECSAGERRIRDHVENITAALQVGNLMPRSVCDQGVQTQG
jgi:hypothetical protein